MPYRVERNKDGTWRVVNALTGKVHAKRTSKARAAAQVRLLQAKER